MKDLRLLPWLLLTILVVPQGVVRAQTPQWSVPESKQIRVIIDSDAACESDDQTVIAYALLSPKIVVRGLVAAHFKPIPGLSIHPPAAETRDASYKEMHEILRVMNLEGCFPVRRGAAKPFPDANTPVDSEGADLIIEEALRDDPRPLFVVFQGPLTDLATAYRKNPSIAKRLTAVWMGGGKYPKGGPEYNQDGDRIAANIVMESDIPLWQIPFPVYLLQQFSMAEAAWKVGRQGPLGAFLFDRLRRFVSAFFMTAESFQYADLPAISLLLQLQWGEDFEQMPAPSIGLDGYYIPGTKNRPIRVYRSFDHRQGLEDLFAKLAAFAEGDLQPRCAGRAAPAR